MVHMAEQEPRQPSEVLGPEAIDQALLVLVVHPDGTAFSSVRSGVDDTSLAAWLTDLAATIASGDHHRSCDDCAAGIPHDHASEA